MENYEMTMDNGVIEEAAEVVTANSGIDFGKIGVGVLVVGAVSALGYKIYKTIKAKKDKNEQEAIDGEVIDNVEVAKRDFLDE